jgi:enoyl-CoA hydratase/carnithine racemase
MALVDAPDGDMPVLKLNRSDKGNALNDTVIAGLLTVADRALADTKTGVAHDRGAS